MAPIKDKLVSLLAGLPEGLTRSEILETFRQENPTLSIAQVERIIRGADNLIVERGNRLVLAGQGMPDDNQPDLPVPTPTSRRPLRVVAIDIESVVQLTRREPYTEVYTFQLGAVRFGWDHHWVRAERNFDAYLQLPETVETAIERQEIRERYNTRREPAAAVLERFRSFVADADVLVAYNGTTHDFPLLDREFERAGVNSLPDLRRVDGLYLALALWPVPPRRHRLRQLTELLRIDVGEALWHNALDDAKVLSILIGFGGLVVLASAQSVTVSDRIGSSRIDGVGDAPCASTRAASSPVLQQW